MMDRFLIVKTVFLITLLQNNEESFFSHLSDQLSFKNVKSSLPNLVAEWEGKTSFFSVPSVMQNIELVQQSNQTIYRLQSFFPNKLVRFSLYDYIVKSTLDKTNGILKNILGKMSGNTIN